MVIKSVFSSPYFELTEGLSGLVDIREYIDALNLRNLDALQVAYSVADEVPTGTIYSFVCSSWTIQDIEALYKKGGQYIIAKTDYKKTITFEKVIAGAETLEFSARMKQPFLNQQSVGVVLLDVSSKKEIKTSKGALRIGMDGYFSYREPFSTRVTGVLGLDVIDEWRTKIDSEELTNTGLQVEKWLAENKADIWYKEDHVDFAISCTDFLNTPIRMFSMHSNTKLYNDVGNALIDLKLGGGDAYIYFSMDEVTGEVVALL